MICLIVLIIYQENTTYSLDKIYTGNINFHEKILKHIFSVMGV